MCLPEHLLCHILRFRLKLPSQDRQSKSKCALAMPRDKLGESLLAPALRCFNELTIRFHQSQRSDLRLIKSNAISPTPKNKKGKGTTHNR